MGPRKVVDEVLSHKTLALDAPAEGLDAAHDDVLAEVRRRSVAAGVAVVDDATAGLIVILVRAMAAGRILEIGSGCGYSGILLARAIADGGRLFTFELDPDRAALAREHFALAGLTDRAYVMVGDAARLVHKVAGPFDIIVDDANLPDNQGVLNRLVALLRDGGVLVSARPRADAPDSDSTCGKTSRTAAAAWVDAGDPHRPTVHPRLLTTILPIGDGVALSVKCTAAATPQV
ncbi:MAG: class I SAM-dependent methyltransferase [Acidobacteriota bacterium]